MFPHDEDGWTDVRLDKVHARRVGWFLFVLYPMVEAPIIIVEAVVNHNPGLALVIWVLTSIVFFCLWVLFGLRLK